MDRHQVRLQARVEQLEAFQAEAIRLLVRVYLALAFNPEPYERDEVRHSVTDLLQRTAKEAQR